MMSSFEEAELSECTVWVVVLLVEVEAAVGRRVICEAKRLRRTEGADVVDVLRGRLSCGREGLRDVMLVGVRIV
jgi:hypothetical protein